MLLTSTKLGRPFRFCAILLLVFIYSFSFRGKEMVLGDYLVKREAKGKG